MYTKTKKQGEAMPQATEVAAALCALKCTVPAPAPASTSHPPNKEGAPSVAPAQQSTSSGWHQ